MLGKLIKHEFKTTSKMMLPLYLVLVALTIFARITAQTLYKNDGTFPDTFGFEAFSVITVMMYVLGLFAICIAIFIYLVMRFYKNLFSNEGYLMHTLPVTSWQLLISKLAVSFVWQLAEILLIALSIFCIFANSSAFEAIRDLFDAYGGFASFIDFYTGMSVAGFWLYLIVFFVTSLLSGILLPYASICIGQLWQKHKLAGSFLAYFVIIMVMQIISTIFSAFKMVDLAATDTSNYFPITTYNFSMVLNIIGIVVFFLVSGFIMKKKINLD